MREQLSEAAVALLEAHRQGHGPRPHQIIHQDEQEALRLFRPCGVV
jgi:hypothetical protein